MSSVGRINVQVGMNTAEVRRGAQQFKAEVAGMSTSVIRSGNGLRGFSREANKVFRETMTPLERYKRAVAGLRQLHSAGAIDAIAYNRAIAMQAAAYRKALVVAEVVTPMTRFREAMHGITAAAGPMGAALGMALGPIALIAGSVAGIKKMLTTAEEFQQAMQSGVAIQPNLPDAMRGRLEAATFRVAQQRPAFNPREYAQGLYYLASAGLDAQQQIAALPVAADFATAGMFDLSRATELLGDSQAAMGLKVADARQNMLNMRRVADVLVEANILSQGSVEQFAAALSNKAAGAARMANMSIEDTVAVLAAFAEQGIKGEGAGEAFSIVLRDLQRVALENKEKFRAFHDAVYDSQGAFRGFPAVIGFLERHLQSLSVEQRKATLEMLGFQERSVAYTQMLVGTSDNIARFAAELNEAGGTAASIANSQMPPLTKAWREFKNVLTETSAIVGKGALPVLAASIQPAVFWLKKFNEGFYASQILITGATASLIGFANTTAKLTGGKFALDAMLGGDAETLIEELNRKTAELTAQYMNLSTGAGEAANGLSGVGNAAREAADGLGEVSEAEKEIESAQKSIADLEKEIRQFNMTASGRAMDDFVRGLQTAGSEADALTQRYRELLAMRDRMEADKKSREQLQNNAGTARDQIKDWQKELFERRNGLTGRDARIAELERMPGVSREAVNWLKQLDAQLDALDKRAAQMEAGKQLREQFMTPMEKFRKEYADIQELLAVGAIDERTADLATRKALGGLMGDREAATAAMQRGSREAYSAVNQAQNEARRNEKLNAMLQNLQALAGELTPQMLAALQEIRDRQAMQETPVTNFP